VTYPEKHPAVAACVLSLERSTRRAQPIETIPARNADDYWRLLQAGKLLAGVSHVPPSGPFAMVSRPLAFRDPSHFKRFKDSPLFRTMAARQAESNGILPVAAAYLGQHALLSTKRISSLEDFKGLRIRHLSRLTEVLGAELSDIPAIEVQPALKNAVIDAAEAPIALIPGLRWADRSTEVYLTGFKTDVVLFSVHAKAWSALSSERRDQLAEWFADAADACSRANYDAETRALATLQAEGVRIFAFDTAQVWAKVPPPRGTLDWTRLWNELQALK
jgi:TRAP-type C4-dicarboxylate transport system substrate-binding protein